MKYLKLFEHKNSDVKYDKGDYIKTHYGINNLGRYFKIIDVFLAKHPEYEVQSLKNNQKSTIMQIDISRELTKKEIEKIEFEQDINNYNL